MLCKHSVNDCLGKQSLERYIDMLNGAAGKLCRECGYKVTDIGWLQIAEREVAELRLDVHPDVRLNRCPGIFAYGCVLDDQVMVAPIFEQHAAAVGPAAFGNLEFLHLAVKLCR